MNPSAPLAGALPAPFASVAGRAGSLAVYHDGAAADGATPLLLLHSVNASASAAEVRPLFLHSRNQRPTYALDLPGYGLSERSARPYTIRLMTDAVHEAVGFAAARHGGGAVDVMALSLATEFAARAAVEAPGTVRRLALVSPTGLNRGSERRGLREAALGPRWLRRNLPGSAAGRFIFRNLTRPGVIRYFLRKTWGSKDIDEEMFRYAVRSAREPGAEHAPLHFVSGGLVSADALTLYEQLANPVWMSHGIRGDFTDYGGAARLAGRANWRIEALPTGALPYFEMPSEFNLKLDAFLA